MVKISEKYTKYHNILVIDEMMGRSIDPDTPKFDCSDFKADIDNLDFFIALNPQVTSSKSKYIDINLPSQSKNIMAHQLKGQFVSCISLGMY